MTMRLVFAFILLLPLQARSLADSQPQPRVESAVLAGGCFWCIEADYEKLDGVIDAESGYAGGEIENPTYKQVSSGRTQHIEVVKIRYDANRISYAEILDFFWRHIDPTRDDGQFCDRGPQYRPAIFYENEQQLEQVEASRKRVEKVKPFAEPLKVEFIGGKVFYPAEDYHQDYYRKNPVRYKFYRFNCGRDARINELWSEK